MVARAALLPAVRLLIDAWKQGKLGGEAMPEDVHPPLARDSRELMHYFTLGMALNYQRNSYALWKAATAAFNDRETAWIFSPELVVRKEMPELASALLKHKVALQPVNHVKIWATLCRTFVCDFEADARQLINRNNGDIAKIKEHIAAHKKSFPYLGGPKICNYWLYVLSQYTTLGLVNRAALSIAPDTHVIQASVRLGLAGADASPIEVAAQWASLLAGSDLCPIDVHTPLWLWSRAGFPEL